MENIIKKVLKETYEYQQLNDICNRISTGSNKNSIRFMNYVKNLINDSEVIPDNTKEECNKIFNSWKQDLMNGVYNDRTENSGTGDSESDESDTYFAQIQSIICSNFMEELD